MGQWYRHRGFAACGLLAGWLLSSGFGVAQSGSPTKSDFPPLDKVTEGYTKVLDTQNGKPSLYTMWVRKKDGKVLVEIPKAFAKQKHFIALTVASGERFAGLQAGDMYVYWKRYDKRMALMEPNIGTRSTGDNESKSSVKRLFTDRVVLDVPILTIVPRGGPVIDATSLLVGQSSKFFGRSVRVSNPNLVTIKTAKAFEKNVELGFEVPTSSGRLQVLHYSISLIPDNTGYTSRVADQRVGYFTTSYSDLGKYVDDKVRTRFINRWHLEKRDPNLKISPPKNPIVFYIEQTTPVRYRRWVKKGVLYWNQAFAKVGLSDAIIVHYQDAATGEHMEKDPEDVQFNFIRWLNNDLGTAIGPSRVHPLTGQILDADIILTDGWIRHFHHQYNDVLPKLAMEGLSPETMAWLDRHPRWDPRIRLAAPRERSQLVDARQQRPLAPYGGHPLANVDPKLLGDDEYDGLIGRLSQCSGMCMAADGKAMDVAVMQMALALAADDDKSKDKKTEELLDGMPEEFIGPLLADLVAHEVGHTLGLRHNFKSSSVYTLAEINSDDVKDKKPFAGSVMDYLPINISMKDGTIQGDYAMVGIGPYDYWAIEFGYSFDKDVKPILARVSDPALAYATDQDTYGPDPLARRYDFGADPHNYAKSQIRLIQHLRENLLDRFVKEGDSWAKARNGYELTLGLQTRSLSMMANWLGGAFIHRDKKGDKNERPPVVVVDPAKQREALDFVIMNSFYDQAFGLTPKLLSQMAADQWLDGGFHGFSDDPAYPVHDRVMGIQASTLSMLMNPTTMQRIYDNEFRVAQDKDTVTLPEVLGRICSSIWSELDQPASKKQTAREPMVSSLRRNLQREHLERLIDLMMSNSSYSVAYKPISSLARMTLREISAKIDACLANGHDNIDPYTKAHLLEGKEQISRALEAQYIQNAGDLGGGSGGTIIILGEKDGRNADN